MGRGVVGSRLSIVNRRGGGDRLECKGRWSGWHDGIVAGETGEPGRRGTSQSCEGQRDRADHPGGEGRSGRRGIVSGDSSKPQLPWIVQSGQGSTSNPMRHDRRSV